MPTLGRKPVLIIFDCDRVLVDREPISCRAHAGMTVLGFHGHCRPGRDQEPRAAGAMLTFENMQQLPGLVAQIDQKRDLIAGFSGA